MAMSVLREGDQTLSPSSKPWVSRVNPICLHHELAEPRSKFSDAHCCEHCCCVCRTNIWKQNAGVDENEHFRVLSSFLNLLKRQQHHLPPPVGDGTALTFVFSFAPDADPTPSLGHHSHLGQQTSHIDEGAEFPTRKDDDSIFQ